MVCYYVAVERLFYIMVHGSRKIGGSGLERRPPRWQLHPPPSPEDVSRVQEELAGLELSPLLVQLLFNRGVREPAEILSFVEPPDLSAYPDPMLMVGMPAAVERICRAIDGGEKITVYGDFDADGVTSTALLTLALRHLGANVEPYIPHRVHEGYGLNAGAVQEIASAGSGLLITVDCGISGHKEVAEARRVGLDVIVTDHHHIPDDLPDAVACINPKQYVPGCECYRDLCGAGVAYQLVRALVKRCGKPRGLRNRDLLGLAAIGTVADIVPLTGANRSLVRQGLEALRQHSLPGLHAMLQFAGINLNNGMDAERIGFIIGPRLNAAGRLDDARVAYDLLMAENPAQAQQLAQKLEALNRRRQAKMNQIVDAARERARRLDDAVKLILLADRDWPSGLIGLVASKLVEEFSRPAVVIELGEEESRGSARSTVHFNIVEALAQVGDLLVRYGGHQAAAGFTVRPEYIEELNHRLGRIADRQLSEEHIQPTCIVDAELPMCEVHEGTYESIRRLAPFGAGNPAPLFMARDVRVLDYQVVGSNANHLKMMLADRTNISGAPVEAMAFGGARLLEAIKQRPRVDVLFSIERHEWKDDSYIRLRIKDLRPSAIE